MGVVYTLAESEELDERVEYRQTFTDTISRDWQLSAMDVCLLSSFGDAVDYVCLIARGDMVATYKRRVRFTDFVDLDRSITFNDLLDLVPRSLRRHVPRHGSVPPHTWTALLAAVKTLRPDAAREIARVEELAVDPSPIFRGRGAEILALERDALGLALMAAEIDRSELLSWHRPQSAAPFLQGLPTKGPIEDRLIDYDASVFAQGATVERDATGVRVFEEGPNRLTVINVNRGDIETALGVDLLYYHHRFRSFVLVQYKRMRKEAGRNVYRPDARLKLELDRMRLVPVSTDRSEDPLDYRLHPGSCYLKLLPRVAIQAARPRSDSRYVSARGLLGRARPDGGDQRIAARDRRDLREHRTTR